MKVTKLETIHVKPRWLFLKVHTDEGIIGLGEPIVEGRTLTVETAVQEIGRYLIGQDPRRIEHHWQAMYRGSFYRGGPVLTSAISGIEQALWDITGKWLGVPVWQLLGGNTRDKIRVYGHFGGDSLPDYIASAQASITRGFTALKTGPGGTWNIVDSWDKVKDFVHRFAALRAAVGDSIDIGVDFHGRISPAMAIRLCRELEPYHPFFVEEPCLPENVDTMVTIARSTTIPIATGERLFTKWGFREVLEKQACVIVQPDVSHAGGILEVKKIAALAETYFAAIAPHCPLGPIALAACLQVDACVPNFLCQEQVNLGDGYLKEPFKIVDGYVPLPTKPGLGIELDDEAVAGKMFAGDWETPALRHPDGSVADW